MEQADKVCTPCQGGIPPMPPQEVEHRRHAVPEWEVMDDSTRISRTFSFKNYGRAFDFVARVSEEAERQGHHPDICFGWGYVTVSLYTHKIKGLHENDFIMAAKFDRLYQQSPSA